LLSLLLFWVGLLRREAINKCKKEEIARLTSRLGGTLALAVEKKMSKQTQKGGEGSTNIQTEEFTVIQGLTYPEVRQVAIDVFKLNFFELAGEARVIAAERAEQVTEDFLRKLQTENPKGFSKAQDPDFQHALFTVQKEYARTGDKELGDLLVDLLVDRSKQDQRNILQIVLNESLSVAPKLTDDQLAALAVIFFCRYTENPSLGNLQMLGDSLNKFIGPFSDKLLKNQACYQHLEYSSCGSIGMGTTDLQGVFGNKYQGCFLKGFDKDEIENRKISIGLDQRVFIACLNNPSTLQVRALNHGALKELMHKLSIPETDQPKISSLFDLNKMNNNEIKEKIIEVSPCMKNIFEAWESSALKNFTLTSVGIAIGHANIKRLVGEFSDLSIWIN
jgi:hypothetical protein